MTFDPEKRPSDVRATASTGPTRDVSLALREAEEQGRRAQAGHLLGRAWEAWDAGDAAGVLALIAQVRAFGQVDLEAAAWMDEAEESAREQVEIAAFQRARDLLRRGDLEAGLGAWLDLSPDCQAQLRAAVDVPALRWLEEMPDRDGRLEAALALAKARAILGSGEADAARALVLPHRTLLQHLADAREALAPPQRPNLPAASPVSIAALASHMAAGGTFKVEAPSSDWALVLALAVRDLLPGKTVDADLDRIQRVIDGRESWRKLPASIAVRLIELIAARLRMLQRAGVVDRRVDLAFSSVSAWSKREKPGYAYGLMRDHRPRTGTWEDDADAAIDDLYGVLPAVDTTPKIGKRLAGLESLVGELAIAPGEAQDAIRTQIRAEVSSLLADGVSARNARLAHILAPVAEELTGPDMRSLRRAARAVASVVPEDDDDGDAPIAPDWAWYAATRGKRAVMVGGDPREPNRVRLERAFGFAELAWEQAEYSHNSLQKVRDRVRAGGVDLVIILSRFVGHDADQVIQPACREAGIPFVAVRSGYGVSGIRMAIERFVAVP